MHSIMYSVIYVCRNVSTFGEEKKSVTGTLSATVPRITQFFFYHMTLQNWCIFFISENGAMKLSQTFLHTWENRLLTL